MKKVILINKAASDIDGIEKFFLKTGGAEGHSLCANNKNVSKDFVNIESVDFSKFILDNFKYVIIDEPLVQKFYLKRKYIYYEKQKVYLLRI
jgi:hypothetical protein